MPNLFDADPAHIATLDSVTLVKLMKKLLLAESRFAGIPLRSAAVPLQVTVADGGEDGRVEWSGGNPSTDYLPSRFNVLQSKAQDLNESAVKNEVLKKPRKGTPALSPAIMEVLGNGGAYLIFCGKPLVTAKRKKLVKAIKGAIVEGGEDPSKAAAIEVYDANAIADWVNTHPAVALWLASHRLGRPLSHFQTYEGWGKDPGIAQVPWQSSEEPRFVPNKDIPTSERVDPLRKGWTHNQAAAAVRAHLANEKAIVRIAGPSGFGKSRYAYEVFADNLDVATQIDAASVIYADGSVSGAEAVGLALEIADAGMAAVLVVDECSDELHIKLADRVRRTDSKLRLVTLDIETRILQVEGTLTVRVEKTDDKHIQEIAKGVAPNLSENDAGFIADLAEGFPRMAVIAAEQNGDGRQTLESVEQVLDRIVWGTNPHNADAQRVLEIASLFDWIGIEGRVNDQAAFITAELAQMTAPQFVEHLRSFRPRGIITERGDFAQVGPVPLAARLGLHRLSIMGADQLLGFFQRAPEHIQNSLLKRLRWLDTSPTAKSLVHALLRPDALGNFAALNTKFGSKCLDNLTHIDPDAVSETIERVFGQLTFDELSAAHDGRRSLIWALEKLVFRRATFDRSARLLRRLAVAENETWGNNATGQFKQLFQLYLSGTEAEPAARLLVLDEGLASNDERERGLCVDALGQMLDAGHFSRSGGSEQIGSGERLEDWRPQTYGEIRDFHRAGVSRLTDIATGGSPQAEKAKHLLAGHIRGLLSQLPVPEVRQLIDPIVARTGFWPEVVSGISSWLYFDSREAPADYVTEVRQLFDDLLPTDLIDLAVLYTNGWKAELHDPDSQYDASPNAKHDFDYSSRKAREIADLIARDAGLVERAVERLACSDVQGAYPFAHQLSQASADPASLFTLAVKAAEDSPSPANRGFFGGIIGGADEQDSRLSKAMVKEALQSEKLRTDAIALIGSGKLNDDDIKLVISLVQSGDVLPTQAASLSYGRGFDHLSQSQFLPLLEELERHGANGLWVILDIVLMYLYGGTKQPEPPLVKLLKRVITTPALMEATRNNMDGYHLQEAIGKLVKMGEVSGPYAAKLVKQLLRICKKQAGHVFYDLDDPARKALGALIELHPKVVWDEISKKLLSPKWDIRYYTESLLGDRHTNDDHLARGLLFPVPSELILEWVRKDPATRAIPAAAWIPVAVKNSDGSLSWDPELERFVSEFGDVPDVMPAISKRLHPSSWWGSLAPYLEPVIPLIESWRTHPKGEVRRWASNQL
ncbi:MAG: hypothetical protein ACYCZR_03155, partial [Burkholderiales bacterium]